MGASAAANCPEGHFCPAPTFFEYEFGCPVGKTNTAGTGHATEADCSTNCPAGTLCREGALTAEKSTALCDAAGYVCPAGSARTTCAPGTYTELGSTATSSTCTTCPVGNFCVGNGPKAQCPAGKYQDATGQSTCKTIGGAFTSAAG